MEKIKYVNHLRDKEWSKYEQKKAYNSIGRRGYYQKKTFNHPERKSRVPPAGPFAWKWRDAQGESQTPPQFRRRWAASESTCRWTEEIKQQRRCIGLKEV